MSTDAILVLIYLAVALGLFVHGRLRVDIVALLLLVALAFSGFITPTRAISGFASPAVMTVAAVFVLSGALELTGVGGMIGRQVLRLAGKSEAGVVATIMLTAGLLSGFMNNVGVAALMLPVVMDISRRISIPPSRLLIPLSFGCLVGGTTTLIGTPPNLLIGEALAEQRDIHLGLFSFTPIGLPLLLISVAYMAFFGRKLLPSKWSDEATVEDSRGIAKIFRLEDRMSILSVKAHSALDGRTLAETQLGAAFGINVLARIVKNRTHAAPAANARLRGGDRLVVEGRLHALKELTRWRHLAIMDRALADAKAEDPEMQVVEVRAEASSPLFGRTLGELDFEAAFELLIWGVWTKGVHRPEKMHEWRFDHGERLVVVGSKEAIETLTERGDLTVTREIQHEERAILRGLSDQTSAVLIPQRSFLIGKSLVSDRPLEAFHVEVVGLMRGGKVKEGETAKAGDLMLLRGNKDDVLLLQSLQELEIIPNGAFSIDMLESDEIAMAEAVLAPHSNLSGKTLRELHFREKYKVNVVAIRRRGRTWFSRLGERPLEAGDGLLFHGSRKRLRILAADRDFLVLTQTISPPERSNKAWLAALIMAAVVLIVLVGWKPIAIAAPAGALLAVLTGCLTVDEAYRYVQWRVVVLIGSMLALGAALQDTGAAASIAEFGVRTAGPLGDHAVLAILCLITLAAAQVMPTTAAAVVMAPIGLQFAKDLNASPTAVLIAIAVSASCNFLTPVGHAANILVMGPGGYRFADFTRVGLPLAILILIATVVLVPLIWGF